MKILESHIVPVISEKIRLQEYAVSLFNNCLTKSALKKAIKKNLLLVDGAVADTSVWIRTGMKLELLKEEINQKDFQLKIPVLFEDDFIAVVQKPAGIPTSGNYYRTLENCLLYNLELSKEEDSLSKIRPAHRLDSETSGLILCAKTAKSLIFLQNQFQQKKIKKVYVALTEGKLDRKISATSPIQQKESKTIISPLEHFTIDQLDYTLVQAEPETGRTHQIRVHLSEAGYPIIGDKIYGRPQTGIFANKALFLFAKALELRHPETGKILKISAKLPKKIRNLTALRGLH